MKFPINTVAIAALTVLFYILENNYFGWNNFPQSPEEVLADGLVVLLSALTILADRGR